MDCAVSAEDENGVGLVRGWQANVPGGIGAFLELPQVPLGGVGSEDEGGAHVGEGNSRLCSCHLERSWGFRIAKAAKDLQGMRLSGFQKENALMGSMSAEERRDPSNSPGDSQPNRPGYVQADKG